MRSMLFELAILLLAGTALSGLPAVTDLQFDTDPMLIYGIVPKTVVSDKFRFFILAGLEGSGHHYIMSAGEAILKAYPDLPRVDEHLNTNPWYLPVAMGESPSHYAEADLWGKEEMQRLAEQAAGFPSPTVYFPKIAMSYPRLHGPEKAMQYNDLKKIAEDAESAGLDMRVLYLKRSAQELIIANTVHRHFQEHLGESGGKSGGTLEDHFLLYLRILFTSIGVLQSFLEELDPGFIACHDWDLLGDEKQASDIATFVSPNDEVADLVRTVLVDKAAPAKHIHIHDGGDEVDGLASNSSKLLVKRLQDKLDSFEVRYCGAPNRAI